MSKRGKYGHGRVYQPKYRAGDGTVRTVQKFYIQFYDRDGHQHRESTNAKSEIEARKILNEKLSAAQKGNAPKVDEKSLRYGDLRADLLHHYRVRKNKSLELLSNGTETVKGLTKLDEFFGYKGDQEKGLRISTFSTRAWENDFIMARRGEGVSDGTIRNSAVLLRQMFNLAVSAGRISFAPKIMVPSPPQAREEYLSKEQFDSLLTRNGMPNKFHPLLTFLFFQGVRIGETLSIEWRQLDLNGGVFKPRAAMNKTGNATPKSLHREVVKVLRPMQQASGLVFDGISQKMFEKAFRRTMLRLGYGKPTWQCSQCRATKNAPAPTDADPAIQCENCKENALKVPMQFHYVGPTPHCLRASAVVYYRESGMPDAMIMEITGHSSPKSFLGYSRTRAEAIKEKMDSAELNRSRIQKEDAKGSQPHLVA